MDPDGGEPIKFFKDYTNKPKIDLETAKKECADACGADNDCKYAMILWIPNESQTKMSKKTFCIHNTKYIIHYKL